MAPTYGIASLIWQELKRTLRGSWTAKNEVEHRIEMPGGGSITVKSGDNPDTLRGVGLDGVVLDEAAFLDEEVWGTVLRPALADRQGWAIFISTPKGLNWFHRLFEMAGAVPGWARWQQSTHENPKIPREEIDAQRLELGSLQYRQEILAEFVSAEGALFKASWFRYYKIENDAFVLSNGNGGRKMVLTDLGHRFATVDLAASLKTSADYTVIGSWHVTPEKDLILLDMTRERLEGPDQIPAIRRHIDRWGLGTVWIERAGYQLALIQMARRQGLPVRELPADKDKIARSLPLQARMEAGTVYFPARAPWLGALETELLGFPPENGQHDDMVDCCAYAAAQVGRGQTPRVLQF